MNTMKEAVNQLKQAYASTEDSEERVKTISDEQIIQLQQVFYNFRIQRISKQDLNSSVSSILKSQEEENYEGCILYPATAYEALQKENAELKATISNLTKAYERESNDCLKALEERDYWCEKTDSLADKISEVFDVPIGEHSNINCPIVEAMKILCGEYVTKFDKESEAQAKRIAKLEELIKNSEVK